MHSQDSDFACSFVGFPFYKDWQNTIVDLAKKKRLKTGTVIIYKIRSTRTIKSVVKPNSLISETISIFMTSVLKQRSLESETILLLY